MYLTFYNPKIYNSILFIILIYCVIFYYWFRKINNENRGVATANIIMCVFIIVLTFFFITPLGMNWFPIGDNFKLITLYKYNQFCRASVIGVILVSFVCNCGYMTYFTSIVKSKAIELDKVSKIHFALFPTTIIYYIYLIL